MRITTWLGTGRQGSQPCPVTLGPISFCGFGREGWGASSNIPPNVKSRLEQTGGPSKLKIPCNFILTRHPVSHCSVTYVKVEG